MMGSKQIVSSDDEQTRACRKLLAAVVSRAVLDCMSHPITNRQGAVTAPDPDASSAFDFIFGRGLDGYAEMLGFDAGQFRTRMKAMRNIRTHPVFSEHQLRAYRANWKLLRGHASEGEV